MKQSILGPWHLPESFEDARLLFSNCSARFTNCLHCGRNLGTAAAAKTPAGWRETQITGWCERCYDSIMAEGESNSGADNNDPWDREGN